MSDNDDMARVSVAVQNFRVDTRLAIHERVSTTIADLIPFLREELKNEDLPTDYLDDTQANWTLVRGISTVLPPGETLDEAGIRHGTQLRLQKTSARETYPALIDDVPESIAAYQKQKFPAWTEESAKKVASFAAPVTAAVVSAGVSFVAVTRDLSWWVSVPLFVVLLALAAVGLITAFLASKKSLDPADEVRRAGVPAAGVGYSFLIAAGLVIVPMELSLWHVVVAGALVATAGLVLRQVTSGIETLTYAAISASGVLAVAAGLSLWLETNPSQFGMIAATLGLFFLLLSSRLSMTLADIPMPYVPTVGESHVNPAEEDITRLPTSASTRAIESIVNRERQIVDAHGAIVGLTSGGIIAVAVAVATMGLTMIGDPKLLWGFVMVVLIAMMFRGSAFDDYTVHLIWIIGIIVVASVFLLALAVSGFSNLTFILLTAGVMTLSAGIFAYRAARESKIVSPVTLRFLEIIETIIYASPMVFVAIALDVYGQIRHG